MHTGKITTVEHENCQEIILPPDNLDSSNVHMFKTWMVVNGKKNLVINMEHVKFLDSSGLGAILGATRHLSEMGCWLKILSPSRSVAALLGLMRIDKVIDICYTRTQAGLPE